MTSLARFAVPRGSLGRSSINLRLKHKLFLIGADFNIYIYIYTEQLAKSANLQIENLLKENVKRIPVVKLANMTKQDLARSCITCTKHVGRIRLICCYW